MEIKVFENDELLGCAAAEAIMAQLAEKEASVLGLPTGSSPLSTYKALISAHKEGRVSFKKVTTFNLDEYVGLAVEHEQSYRYFMNDNLFYHIDIDIANTNLPCDGSDIDDITAAEYDEKIKAAGGIDLQLLGIGNNGHIAFNEPGTPFDSLTHKQRITENTREANARFFEGDINKVPCFAVTLGLKAIMNAKKIVLVASGKAKAKAVYDMINGPVTTDVPASVLQLHPNCTVYLDKDAASLL